MKKVTMVKTRVDRHSVVRYYDIFERAKFNRRSQEEGESVDSFITSLNCIAEYCEYCVLEEEMIGYRFVVWTLVQCIDKRKRLRQLSTILMSLSFERWTKVTNHG